MSNSIRYDPNFHFHDPRDLSQTRSAQRGTIVPTWGDRRRAAWRDSGSKRLDGLARFSFALRAASLETRRALAIADCKLSKGGALLRRSLADIGNKDPLQTHVNRAEYDNAKAAAEAQLEIRNCRIDAKLEVGKAAGHEELREAVDLQNAIVQSKLEAMGYVPTAEPQSDVAHRKSEARYLMGETGHRVQHNVSQAPAFARALAGGAAALHDSRARGLSRAAQKAALGTGAIGYALMQAAKRGTYGALKHLADPGSPERTSFDRRGDAAAARTRMAFAALRGTRALNMAVATESSRREDKLESALPGYRPALAIPDRKPSAVGWTTRAINEYIAGSEKPNPLIARAAGLYIACRNVGPQLRTVVHGVRAGLADARYERAAPGTPEREAASAAGDRYRNQLWKAADQYHSNKAALTGELAAEVASQQRTIAEEPGMARPAGDTDTGALDPDAAQRDAAPPAQPTPRRPSGAGSIARLPADQDERQYPAGDSATPVASESARSTPVSSDGRWSPVSSLSEDFEDEFPSRPVSPLEAQPPPPGGRRRE